MEYTKGSLPTWYGRSSSERLGTCHDIFQQIFNDLAQDGWEISILCGHRGEDDQNLAYEADASNAHWHDSNHNTIPSAAIDAGPYILGYGIPGYGNNPYNNEAEAIWMIFVGQVLLKAQNLGFKIKWGGFFPGLKDLGHFELI